MIDICKKLMLRVAELMEIILAIFLVMVLILVIGRTVIQETPLIWTEGASIHHYLEESLTLAIAIEFVKMLSLHTPGTLIEVLLFAVARHMLVETLTPLQTLAMIVCICALFAARKYLLTSHDQRGMNEHTQSSRGLLRDLADLRKRREREKERRDRESVRKVNHMKEHS